MFLKSNLPTASTFAEAEKAYREAIGLMGELPESAYRIAIPDNAHGGRGFDLVSMMFKYRMIYLHGPVTQEAVQSLTMQLHYLCSEAVLKQPGRETRITFYVDSPGGLVDWGLTLFDYIRQAEVITREPVATIIQTMGASMGSLLPQAATTGYRLIMPRGEMMIHALSYGSQGKREDHTRGTGATLKSMAELYEIYIDKMAEARVLFEGKEDTPELRAEILTWLLAQMENKDTFLSPSACLKAGLIDFVPHTEDEQFEYYAALDWYHGLCKKNAGGTFDPAERDPESGRITPFELSADEKAEALAKVISLREANIEKTRAIEARRGPIEAALDALDAHRRAEGRGESANPYDAYKAAAEVLKNELSKNG